MLYEQIILLSIMSTISMIIFLLLTIFRFYMPKFNERIIVTKFGQVKKIQKSGIVVFNAITDHINIINISDQIIDMDKQTIITLDHATVDIDAFIGYRVIDQNDSYLKTMNITNIRLYIVDNTSSIFRGICARLNLMDVLKSRETISRDTLKNMNEELFKYGIFIFKIEIKNIYTDEQLTCAMNEQISTNIEKNNMIIKTEGEIESMKIIMNSFESYTDQQINILLMREYITMLEKNKNNIIVTSYNEINDIKNFITNSKINEINKK